MEEMDTSHTLLGGGGGGGGGGTGGLRAGGLKTTHLYASHFLSAFGDRLWQFAIPVLFMEIWDQTLLPSAIFSFAIYSSSLLFMPAIGTWVDRSPRLPMIRTSILVQNVSIFVSSGLMVRLCAAMIDVICLTWPL